MKNKAGPPVRRTDFLVRTGELRELWHLVTRGHVILLAPRRAGKTSILLRMLDASENGWVCLYLSVESLDSEAHFMARLLTKILEAHPDGEWMEALSQKVRKLLASFGKTQTGPFEIDLAEALKDNWRETGAAILRVIRRLHGNTLILVDEFPEFVQRLLGKDGNSSGKARAELFLHWFRDIRNAPHDGEYLVHFLLTGSIGLAGVVQAAGLSGTLNDLHSYRLGPLTTEQSRELLAQLSEGEGLPLPLDVTEKILERIDWPVPYHLQLLFQEILSQARFRGKDLDVTLVENAYQALLAAENKAYFHHWVDRLDQAFLAQERDLSRSLLRAAAKDRRGISPGTIFQIQRKTAPDVNAIAVLTGLDHDGYLTLHDGRWRFTSALLCDWWRKWQVKDT